MKKIVLLTLYCILFGIAANANPLDSLRQQLQTTTDDGQKASIYTQLAKCYLTVMSSPNAYTKRINQENAINYAMLAMKLYYKHDDTTGLVTSYSSLSRAYRNQGKLAQAKWFILAANTLSRKQRSPASITSTLVDLAEIKMDNKEYKMAKRDLKEAHRWALKNSLAQQDSLVKISYSRLYTFIQVPPEENVFQGLDETIKKEDLATAEKLKKLATLKAKKLPKKLYAVADKKRSDPIKLKTPAIYWETPSNKLTNDSLKTISL